MSEHTPLPWAKHPTGVATIYAPSAKNRIVAGCGSWTDNKRDVIPEQEANAALIITAVNSHESLVEALKAVQPFAKRFAEHCESNFGMVPADFANALSNADAALRKAGEEA